MSIEQAEPEIVDDLLAWNFRGMAHPIIIYRDQQKQDAYSATVRVVNQTLFGGHHYLHLDLAYRAKRDVLLSGGVSPDEDPRYYTVPLIQAFRTANRHYSGVEIDAGIMAGAPCIAGTRIPVYMILDAIEHYGTLDGALESYPRLTLEQIKQAIGFAKLVVECPIEHEDTVTS